MVTRDSIPDISDRVAVWMIPEVLGVVTGAVQWAATAFELAAEALDKRQGSESDMRTMMLRSAGAMNETVKGLGAIDLSEFRTQGAAGESEVMDTANESRRFILRTLGDARKIDAANFAMHLMDEAEKE